MNTKTVVLGAAALALAIASVPATASAGDYGKHKFGAKLTESVQPSNSLPAKACDEMDPAELCTFVMNEAYGRPNDGHKSSEKGRLTKVKIVSGGATEFRLQLVKAKYEGGEWQAKVKKQGPWLETTGQSQSNWDNDEYKVEKYKVDMKIKKGWRLAMQTSSTSAVRCSNGGENTLKFTPQLHSGWGWQTASETSGCYPLLEGKMKYKK